MTISAQSDLSMKIKLNDLQFVNSESFGVNLFNTMFTPLVPGLVLCLFFSVSQNTIDSWRITRRPY